MILPLVLVGVAMVGGAIAGRTIKGFPATPIRSWWLAPIGLVLQAVPGPGDLDYVPLVVSFVVLLVFVGINVRAPGFILLLVGIALNLLVIASNLGMPVTREALRDSGQLESIETLATDTKHRLATRHTVLRPLGDAIGLARPVRPSGERWRPLHVHRPGVVRGLCDATEDRPSGPGRCLPRGLSGGRERHLEESVTAGGSPAGDVEATLLQPACERVGAEVSLHHEPDRCVGLGTAEPQVQHVVQRLLADPDGGIRVHAGEPDLRRHVVGRCRDHVRQACFPRVLLGESQRTLVHVDGPHGRSRGAGGEREGDRSVAAPQVEQVPVGRQADRCFGAAAACPGSIRADEKTPRSLKSWNGPTSGNVSFTDVRREPTEGRSSK